MLNIKVKDSGECKIVISGDQAVCAFQMSKVAENIFKENPLIADAFLFGLATQRSKEATLKEVDRAYDSIAKGKELKKTVANDLLKELDKMLDKIVKDLGGKKDE